MENLSFIRLFMVVLLLGVGLAIPFVALWLWAFKNGRASVRLLAAGCGAFIFCTGTILWFFVKEDWLVLFTFVCSFIACAMVLTWPFTAPKIIKRLGLKW
jgi:hypothetical protein